MSGRTTPALEGPRPAALLAAGASGPVDGGRARLLRSGAGLPDWNQAGLSGGRPRPCPRSTSLEVILAIFLIGGIDRQCSKSSRMGLSPYPAFCAEDTAEAVSNFL